jgi:hypothetical protein
VHNNASFADPSEVAFEGGTIAYTGNSVSGTSIRVLSIGSTQNDRIIMKGVALRGDIVHGASPWQCSDLTYQPADHMEWRISGYGNSPAVYQGRNDWGRALKIESANTGSGSSVVVSGDAVPVIMGTVTQRDGSGGIKGYSYGYHDVSGSGTGPSLTLIITKIGQRLGDCTSVNKTLTVAVDGGAPINIVFNANYTAVDNATMLATINSALGAAATASLYDVGGRYRPSFTDEEQTLWNNQATGFLMGSVLAWDGGRTAVRLMTSTDPASLFAGVAWEDIYPGTYGRVKTKGWLTIADVLRTDAVAFAYGDTFSVDAAAPGQVYKGGSQGLLMGIRTDAVQVAAK